MGIEVTAIRAKVTFGTVVVETPYILSFGVSKSRNSSSTFNAAVKILTDDLGNITDNNIVIEAGVLDDLNTIFTGYVLRTAPSPCWEDPNYVTLNISGSDILYRLQNEKYTRRQIAKQNKWAAIDSVTKKADKGAQFKLINSEVLVTTGGSMTTKFQEQDTQRKNSDISNLAQAVPSSVQGTINIAFGPITNTETNETAQV
jgi:hypothetical protein